MSFYDEKAGGFRHVNTASGGLQETRLKQDVYYLEKPRRKTEALIFGSHDSSTLEMTQKMSDYLDILWGAETIPWSMYYLNGLDNSLILVSTLPLKDLSSSFKESTISSVVARTPCHGGCLRPAD